MMKPTTPDMMAATILTLKKTESIIRKAEFGIFQRTALSAINVQKLTKYFKLIYLHFQYSEVSPKQKLWKQLQHWKQFLQQFST